MSSHSKIPQSLPRYPGIIQQLTTIVYSMAISFDVFIAAGLECCCQIEIPTIWGFLRHNVGWIIRQRPSERQKHVYLLFFSGSVGCALLDATDSDMNYESKTLDRARGVDIGQWFSMLNRADISPNYLDMGWARQQSFFHEIPEQLVRAPSKALR